MCRWPVSVLVATLLNVGLSTINKSHNRLRVKIKCTYYIKIRNIFDIHLIRNVSIFIPWNNI